MTSLESDAVRSAPVSSVSIPQTATVAKASKIRNPFVALLLLALAVVVWLGFQCLLLTLESRQLAAAQVVTSQQEQTATRIRASLDSIATATAKLAADGNPTARAMVDELRKRGVTINTQSAVAPK